MPAALKFMFLFEGIIEIFPTGLISLIRTPNTSTSNMYKTGHWKKLRRL